MNILEKIRRNAIEYGEHIALLNPNTIPSQMTYRELYCKAHRLSKYINDNVNDKNPIVVVGHKNPYMIVSFLACVMSGHAYTPIDISMPKDRIEAIMEQTESSIVIVLDDDLDLDNNNILKISKIAQICAGSNDIIAELPDTKIKDNETYYIIFTSGSTGVPKGVEITSDDLDNFLVWAVNLGEEKAYGLRTRFLNQAPFSFDLSVMDLYTSLYCGATLCMMDKAVQNELQSIQPFIADNNITAIVSTPSFVDMCLIDKRFNEELLPNLESFFFCGETLHNKTAKKLLKRFPNAVIQNTYGPTESTVAVSSVRITQTIVDSYDPLPVGIAKEGTEFIISEDNTYIDKGHIYGEVLITGNTLAKGYFKRTDLTKKAFVNKKLKGKVVRAYRTGDTGFIDGEQLFYGGRIDFQIKLNGYRIEIGDIENNLLKISGINQCVVLPVVKNGVNKSLTAFIVTTEVFDNEFEYTQNIKDILSVRLPKYMIPKKFIILTDMPVTNNGKIDRKALQNLL